MPANPSNPETPDQSAEDAPMSRAERRAAARAAKHGARTEVPVWNSGKVHGSRGAPSTRRQYTNRKTGG
jgi:hypothetical protein